MPKNDAVTALGQSERPTVGINEICHFLAGQDNEPLSPERIRQYCSQGMPKVARGEYDKLQCGSWLLGRLRRMAAHKETEDELGSISGIQFERKRLLKNQADLKEAEMAVMRGDLISIQTWKKYDAERILTAKARLLAVPARVAPRLVGETSRVLIQGLIDKEIKEALLELSKGK